MRRHLPIVAVVMASATACMCGYFVVVFGGFKDDVCSIRLAQRHQLEQAQVDTDAYLSSPAGRAHTAFNAFIKDVSVPQLKERLATETVPSSCTGKGH